MTRKQSWIIYLVFILFDIGTTKTPKCLSGWTRSGQTCLLIKNDYQVTRDEADKDCKSHDSTLLRFENGDDMNSFVNSVSKFSVDGWWTDLNELHHPGIWTWGDNEEVFNDALIWNQEPDDTHHVENCVSMSYEGKISDEMCSKKLGFICEYMLPGDGSGCADGWISSTSSCYYISHTEDNLSLMTWMDALGKCLAMVLGQTPTLISLSSADEYKIISKYLSFTPTQDISWWIGLNDQTTEGAYVWTDGPADLSYMQWDKAPNKLALVDKCGVVHGNGHMSYGQCNKDMNYYICKLKITNSNLVVIEELGCSGLWTRAGHKCYFFDPSHRLTQPDARKHCQQNGGDLLKVESLDEMYWLTQQTFQMKGSDIWTGLIRKSKGANSWTWADKSDVNIEFIKWNQEPNDYVGNEDCAMITRDGVYNDLSCTGKAGFICQMHSVNAPCPANWIMPDQQGSLCYYISDTDENVTTTWYAANDKCSQLANGADTSLFAPQNSDDYIFVSQQLTSRPPDPTGWWTDLTDSGMEGVWKYSNSYNGPPDRSLIIWGGEPNDFGGNEDCVAMYYGGRYNDVECTAKAKVVCEKPATPFPSSGNIVKIWSSSYYLLLTFLVYRLCKIPPPPLSL